jgi:predicted CopG family antitoxin
VKISPQFGSLPDGRIVLCSNICLNVIHHATLTKTITIRDQVYRKLAAVKRKDESFSELFERLVEGTNSIEVLKRLRGSVEFKNKERMLSEIEALRAERRL